VNPGRAHWKGAYCIHVENAAIKISCAADLLTVEIEGVGGIKAHLRLGIGLTAEGVKIGVAANPEMRLAVLRLPLRIRLPAGFIEIGRGPGEVVTRMPYALLRSDSDDGLRSERTGKRREED